METVNRLRVEDMIKEINDRLDKFSLESGIKARLRLSKEKKHLINLLLYIFSKNEAFDKGRLGVYIRFAFPLSILGDFLGTGFALFSNKRFFDPPVVIDDIEGGGVENPTLWVVVWPILELLENEEEKFRLYDFLEDLGFNTDNSMLYPLYPYIKYTLDKGEYLLEK